MPIVFDEITAEVAPPPDSQRGAPDSDADAASAAAQPADPNQLRSMLALLREREARSFAD